MTESTKNDRQADPKKTRNRTRDNGEGTIWQNPKTGKFRVRVTVGIDASGRQKYKTSWATSKTEAKAKLRQMVRERDEGLLTLGPDMTVAAWMTHWLNEIAQPSVRPKTYDGYASIVNLWVIPTIGRTKLAKLEPEHLDRLYAAMRGGGRSETTVLLAHRVMSRALKIAVRRKKVGRNVATLIDAPTAERPDIEPFTIEECRKILKAAADRDNPSRWTVALAIGARQGEALGLAWEIRWADGRRWSAVDLDGGTVDIQWQLQREIARHGCGKADNNRTYPCGRKRGVDCPDRQGGGLVMRRPKSAAGRRRIQPPATLLAELKTHRREQLQQRLAAGEAWIGYQTTIDGVEAEVDLVFTRPDGRPIDPRDDLEEWHALLAAAGVRKGRLHDARHTAATILLMEGHDTRTVMDILGHSSEALTHWYQKVVPELRESAAADVDAALWGDKDDKARKARRQRDRARTLSGDETSQDVAASRRKRRTTGG